MRKHRGLSAIVGTVFLVAVVIGALSYVTYSMNVLGNFSESLIIEEKRQKDQKDEAFEITSISVNQNKLDGIVKNTGEIPIRITNLYVDEQGVNDDVQKFVIDDDILPGNTINLLDFIDYAVDPTKGYNVKLVSSRGAVQTVYINSPSSESLLMNIRAVPEFVPSEFTTTILYSIVNNMSNNNILYNVTPQLIINDVVGADVASLRSGPNPSSYPVLAPGDVAIFEYVVKMSGNVDDSVIFNATITNGVAGNFVTTTSTVREVTVATQAGTALESYSLGTDISQFLDILYFHDEADLTPNGEYQMDGSDISGSGTTGNLEDDDFEFITANVTSDTIIYPGDWNMPLGYYNEIIPEGITTPSFAFMMECKDCPAGGDIFDTIGNISGDDFRDNGNPTWNANGGPDNKAYFNFDGNDDFRAEWDAETDYTAYSDIQSNAVTTAVWFRIQDTNDQYMPIIRWGDENDNDDDEYEIALGAKTAGTQGDIVYRYTTDIDNDETRCITTDGYDYDDGQWHFVVGKRSGDDDCELYVDGVLKDNTPQCINGPCSGSSLMQIDDTDDIFIGHDGESDYLIGDVAMFMHWNNVELNAAHILELNNTNYGLNATRVHITIERTNGIGTPIVTLYDQDFSFPFHDTSIRGDAENSRIDLQINDNDWKKYNSANFTFNTIANTTFNFGDRLKLSISWPGDLQNLPLHFRFDDDDNNFVTNDITSYVQTPFADPTWPTFLSFDRDDHVEYVIFNSGPNGAWFTYGGTRFVITNLDGTESYGAIVETVNGTAVDETQDSIYIPNQNTATIEFYPLKNPPIASTGGGTKPPVGTYVASVFLSGFDDKGEVFLRTIGLGTIYVHDNG